VPKKISARKITTLQMKESAQKGCQIFKVHVEESEHQNREIKFNIVLMINKFWMFFQSRSPVYHPIEI